MIRTLFKDMFEGAKLPGFWAFLIVVDTGCILIDLYDFKLASSVLNIAMLTLHIGLYYITKRSTK